MSREDEIEELLSAHHKRQHKLRVRKALDGIDVDPKVALEIDEIEIEIQELRNELRGLREKLPPSEVERKLSDANIILSETGSEREELVRVWLINDPAYQALAQMCLTILEGKMIIGGPIPLEVINGRYKMEHDFPSGKYLSADKYSDEHLDKLKTAIFKIWKERNTGYSQSSFDEIVMKRPR